MTQPCLIYWQLCSHLPPSSFRAFHHFPKVPLCPFAAHLPSHPRPEVTADIFLLYINLSLLDISLYKWHSSSYSLLHLIFRFIYLLIWGSPGSLLLLVLSLIVVTGGHSSCGVRASHCGSFSCCTAQDFEHGRSFGTQGLAAPRHVASVQIRDWTWNSSIAGRFFPAREALTYN